MVAQKERGFESPPWSRQLECGGVWAWGPARVTAPPGCPEAAGKDRGAQAPGCKRAGLLLCKDRGPHPTSCLGEKLKRLKLGSLEA